VAPQWLLAYSRLGDALRLVAAGLREYPEDAELLFLAGTLHERMTSPLLDPYQFNNEERRRREQTVRSSLGEAERAFRHALQASPTHVEARLHLGHILDQQQRPDEARDELGAVLASSPRPDVAWLARMFLGRIQLRAGRVDEAFADFRAAYDILPSQTASVALAHALERGGSREAARAQLRSLTPAPGGSPLRCDDGCDPWQQYDLVDRERVGALIKHLVQQACSTP
jgi:tetratricopeptide (TPR) repeat protein